MHLFPVLLSIMDFALLPLAVLALIAAWRLPHPIGPFLLAGAVCAGGIVSGLIDDLGATWLALLFGLTWWLRQDRVGWPAGAALGGFGLLAVLAGFGVLPGLEKMSALGPEVIKEGSAPFTRNVSPGLVAITLLLLALHPLSRSWSEAGRSIRTGVLVGLATSVPVLLTGWAMGGLAWQPEFPVANVMAIWLLGQVLTLTMEEGFFRGFLMRWLARVLPVWAAIGISGVLFGLAHFAGGAAWIVAASIAGVGYGLAYYLAGQRLEGSMAAHLTVNLLHIGLWSYPNLQL